MALGGRAKQFIAALASAIATGAFPADVPEGWQFLKLTDDRKPTTYRLVTDGGRQAVHARAEASASGVYKAAGFNITERPVASWAWKVSALIANADHSKASREDSPARIVLSFEGDRDKLPLLDRAVMWLAKRLYGRDLPYATLMYIWSNAAPVGTVIANPHTRRIQMIVASSGAAGVGAWQELSRDVADDYRRAFREEPGRMFAYGFLSDTDNTGETVEAWYGEIEFRKRPGG